MKANSLLMWLIVILLIAVSWLTFHDFGETHTVRDWLTILSSILVLLYFCIEHSKKSNS